MRRGDLVTIVLQGAYGKPRPALIIQSDLFSAHPSVTIIPITSELRDTPLFRVPVRYGESTGLRKPSEVTVSTRLNGVCHTPLQIFYVHNVILRPDSYVDSIYRILTLNTLH